MKPEGQGAADTSAALSDGSKKRRREIDNSTDSDYENDNGEDENNDGDIVEINVSGEFFTTTFGTLRQVVDSTLAMMFSKPWFGSLVRDSNGRVFLDHDPDHFKIIIRFLRMTRIEDPFDPAEPWGVPPPPEKRDFDQLLRYLGLFDLFYRTVFRSLDIKHNGVVLRHSSQRRNHGEAKTATVTKTDDKIEFSFTATEGLDHLRCHCDTLFQPSSFDLGSLRDGLIWKVTIGSFDANTCGLYLLIIRNDQKNIHYDEDNDLDSSTCYGWKMCSSFRRRVNAPPTESRVVHSDNFWTGFTEGECLCFRLEQTTLSMRSDLHQNQKFRISDIPESPNGYALRFVFLFPSLDTRAARTISVTLESLEGEEAERLFADKRRE